MSMEEPIWWKYAVLEDVDGVGIVKGFKKGTPKEAIKNYKAYIKEIEKLREKDPYIEL